MPTVTVRQGDCFNSIADETGFFWETLWDRTENAGLREKRRSPSTLAPGDSVFVPDKTPKSISCATGKTHVFRRKGVPSKLNLVLLDRDSQPRAGLAFTLSVNDVVTSGKTGDGGDISVAIPPRAARATLTLTAADGTGETYQLQLGHLNPSDDVAGVQSRLRNLGYYTGPTTGALDALTREALALFQSRSGLAQTGEPDADTKAALAGRHGV